MRLLALSFTAALIAAPALRAAADLLTPVSDGRYVLAEHCPAFAPCQSQSARPPSPFAPFDAEVSVVGMSASQDSQWTGNADQAAMHGSLASGSATDPPLGTTTGDAVFDIGFDASAAASWSWTGAGALSGGGYGDAFLYDSTSDTVLFERSLPASFSASGSLAPGHRYQLFVHATTLGQGGADWSFDFSAVPEPDETASLACGFSVTALLARRRRIAAASADIGGGRAGIAPPSTPAASAEACFRRRASRSLVLPQRSCDGASRQFGSPKRRRANALARR